MPDKFNVDSTTHALQTKWRPPIRSRLYYIFRDKSEVAPDLRRKRVSPDQKMTKKDVAQDDGGKGLATRD